MTTTIRAKFAVTCHTRHAGGSETVTLEPRYDESIPEDQRFYQYTPYGKLEMSLNNPLALRTLMPDGALGREFYLDLIPCHRSQES